MALTQKSRVTDNCIVIFIQNQLIETHNINSDNFAKTFPPENDEIRIIFKKNTHFRNNFSPEYYSL